MQDQAFLGPESGLAVPAEDGGVDLYVATQWLHVDQQQIAARWRLPPDKVRLTLAGVGGAFGAREDLSMQVHACLLALHTGKPVKMVVQPRGVVLRPRAPAPGVDALRARRRPATATWSTCEAQICARRRRLRCPAAPAVVGNAGDCWASGPTWCRTCGWTATAPTRTTRRAARCAASARCRPAFALRVADGQGSPPRWASTRSSSAAATR